MMNKEINNLIDTENSANCRLAEQLLIGQGLTDKEAKEKVYGFNIRLFFRLISSMLNSRHLKSYIDATQSHRKDFQPYDILLFHCPRIHCIDGFNVSFQIHYGNYCESENGYRNFGYDWKYVEFGLTSEHEPLFEEFAEDPNDTTSTVGSIPIEVVEKCIEKHGGINWLITLSRIHMKDIVKR